MSKAFARWPARALVLVAVTCILAVGYGDWATGLQLSFTVFYLFPLALVAWFASAGVAIVLAFLSAAVGVAADVAAGRHQILLETWNTATRVAVWLLFVMLLSKLRSSLFHQRTLARTDFLTGLPNNRAFEEAATAELLRSRRYRNEVTVAYFDLDDFKDINDERGHAAGDEVLKVTAAALQASTRDTDLVVRLGGDEFAILFAETGEAGALTVLKALGLRVRDSLAGLEFPVAFTVGAVTFLSPPATTAQMLKAADELMYEAKAAGKNSLRHKTLLHV